ncbi:MAG: hypothetical protein KC620_26195, partial [Myxococcales bacterium]|nr:hypothetical protein [Myxococcales bacterium]
VCVSPTRTGPPIPPITPHVCVSPTRTWLDGHPIGAAPPGVIEVGFGPDQRPVLAALGPDGLTLRDLRAHQTLSFGMAVDALTSAEGRLYALACDRLVELALHAVGPGLVVAPRVVAHLARHATRLYPGLVVQALRGVTFLGFFDAAGGCAMVPVPPLAGHRVVEAIGARGVAALIGERDGRYDRFLVRLDAFGQPEVQVDADVASPAVDLCVLDTGVCVLREADGALTLFPRRAGEPGRKTIAADLPAALRLVPRGSRLGFVHGARIGWLRMRRNGG